MQTQEVAAIAVTCKEKEMLEKQESIRLRLVSKIQAITLKVGSRRQLALSAGINPETMRSWIVKEHYPKLDNLIALSSAMGMTLTELVSELESTFDSGN